MLLRLLKTSFVSFIFLTSFLISADEYISVVIKEYEHDTMLHAVWIGDSKQSFQKCQTSKMEEFQITKDQHATIATALQCLMTWISNHPQNTPVVLLYDRYSLQDNLQDQLKQQWHEWFPDRSLTLLDIRPVVHQDLLRCQPQSRESLFAKMRYLIHLHKSMNFRFKSYTPDTPFNIDDQIRNQNFEQIHAYAWTTNLFSSSKKCISCTSITIAKEVRCSVGDSFENPDYCYLIDEDGYCWYGQGGEDLLVVDIQRRKDRLFEVFFIYSSELKDSEFLKSRSGYYDGFPCYGGYETCDFTDYSRFNLSHGLKLGRDRFYAERSKFGLVDLENLVDILSCHYTPG